MAEEDEDLLMVANIVKSLLKSMGVEDFESQVIRQFLELWYRYVVDVQSDALATFDFDDLKLAIQSKVNFSFSQPPPRVVLLDLARSRNKIPLPRSISGPGIPLPPDKDILISPISQVQRGNLLRQLKKWRKLKKVLIPTHPRNRGQTCHNIPSKSIISL